MAENTDTLNLYDKDGGIVLGGSANAYTATTSRSITAYYQGLRICGKAGFTNNGASTLNVNGIGAAAIRRNASVALTGGEIVSGQYYDFSYDFANGWFQVLNPAVTDASTLQGLGLTASGNRWGIIASVLQADGGMEIGQYIDFHNTDGDTSDFAFRLDSFSSALGLAITKSGGSAEVVQQAGVQTLWVPASGIYRRTGDAGPSSGQIASSSGCDQYLAYDPTNLEDAFFNIVLPKSWNGSSVGFQVHWSHPATTTNFNVVWDLFMIGYSNGDSISGSGFGGAGVTDTGGSTNTEYVSDLTTFGIGNSPAAGDRVNCIIRRDAGNASDTLAVDAFLQGVVIFLTTNRPNDD